MGKPFGQLYKISGVIKYSLSPFEQRAYAKASEGISRTIRRTVESFLYVVPPLAVGYLIFIQADNLHAFYLRKTPGEYDDDK